MTFDEFFDLNESINKLEESCDDVMDNMVQFKNSIAIARSMERSSNAREDLEKYLTELRPSLSALYEKITNINKNLEDSYYELFDEYWRLLKEETGNEG